MQAELGQTHPTPFRLCEWSYLPLNGNFQWITLTLYTIFDTLLAEKHCIAGWGIVLGESLAAKYCCSHKSRSFKRRTIMNKQKHQNTSCNLCHSHSLTFSLKRKGLVEQLTNAPGAPHPWKPSSKWSEMLPKYNALALDHFLALMLSQGRTEYYGKVSPVRLVFKHTSLSTNDLCLQWHKTGWKPASHPNWTVRSFQLSSWSLQIPAWPTWTNVRPYVQSAPLSPSPLSHRYSRCCIVQLCSHVWQPCCLPAARVYSVSPMPFDRILIPCSSISWLVCKRQNEFEWNVGRNAWSLAQDMKITIRQPDNFDT